MLTERQPSRLSYHIHSGFFLPGLLDHVEPVVRALVITAHDLILVLGQPDRLIACVPEGLDLYVFERVADFYVIA